MRSYKWLRLVTGHAAAALSSPVNAGSRSIRTAAGVFLGSIGNLARLMTSQCAHVSLRVAGSAPEVVTNGSHSLPIQQNIYLYIGLNH